MSIWNDCQTHNAVPFFGYAVIPSFKDGVFSLEFNTVPADILDWAHSCAKDMKIDPENVSVEGNTIHMTLSNDKIGYILYEVLKSGGIK